MRRGVTLSDELGACCQSNEPSAVSMSTLNISLTAKRKRLVKILLFKKRHSSSERRRAFNATAFSAAM